MKVDHPQGVLTAKKKIDAAAIAAAFDSATASKRPNNVVVITRFADEFDDPTRWEDSGIAAMASQFMGMEDNPMHLDAYLRLLLARAEQRPEILDDAYAKTMERSEFRTFIASLRFMIKSGITAHGTLVQVLSHLARLPLHDYDEWPDRIKQSLRKIDGLCLA